MKINRANHFSEPALGMSRTARADIEALRASDRLQHIFQGDFRPDRPRVAARRDIRAPAPMGHAAATDKKPRASRRTRMVVGLLPVFLGLVVLAAEGISSMRDGPEPAAKAGNAGIDQRAAYSASVQSQDRATPQRSGKAAAASNGEQRSPEGREGDTSATPPQPRERPAAITAADGGPAVDAIPGVMSSRSETEGDPALARSAPERAASNDAPPEARITPAEPGKASDELAKAIDLASAIRRSVAAARTGGPAARLADARSSAELDLSPVRDVARPLDLGAVADEGTVPQASWPLVESMPVPPPRQLQDLDAPAPAPAPARAESRDRAAAAFEPGTKPALKRAAAGIERTRQMRSQPASASPRIVVHFQGVAGASEARRLASTLTSRGMVRTELRRVPVAISRANVRYFHDQNRSAAREVNEVLHAMGRRSDLRDFTNYAPLPSVGTIEIWLPG